MSVRGEIVVNGIGRELDVRTLGELALELGYGPERPGVAIAVTTDAHSTESLAYAELGIGQARRAWLTKEHVLNTRPWAVIADGKPWVRYVMTEAADDLTLRCCSFINARKVAQIASNPEVHLTCGISQPTIMGPYLQIQGRAEFATGRDARHAFWSDRLRAVFKGPDDPNYGVVIIHAYRIEFCQSGAEPEVWEREQ